MDLGPAWPVVAAVILPVLMAAISGAVIPAWRASRIPPVEALESSG